MTNVQGKLFKSKVNDSEGCWQFGKKKKFHQRSLQPNDVG